jgi:hypothetical protein
MEHNIVDSGGVMLENRLVHGVPLASRCYIRLGLKAAPDVPDQLY